MTRPNEKVKPEPTQADREKARVFHKQDCPHENGNIQYPEHGNPAWKCRSCLASELAAVKREGAFSTICEKHSVRSEPPQCHYCVREEAHNAEAAKMMERCAEIADNLVGAAKNGQIRGDLPIPITGESWTDWCCRVIATSIRNLSPDPNYLQGKIEASTKELREALEFYAAKENYQPDVSGRNNLGVYENVSDPPVYEDGGEVARQALKETEGDKNEL